MVDPHTVSLFQDTVVDPRFPIALGIAALAGLVRGFSGFGSALVYMPLISAVYGPTVAAPTTTPLSIGNPTILVGHP